MLALDELIAVPLTRREWAVILVGLAEISDSAPVKIRTLAEDLTTRLQKDDIAPVGVLSRTLADLS